MTDFTGRDHYVTCAALAFAIVTIERLPDQWQAWSDAQDMRKLLFGICTPEQAEFYLRNV